GRCRGLPRCRQRFLPGEQSAAQKGGGPVHELASRCHGTASILLVGLLPPIASWPGGRPVLLRGTFPGEMSLQHRQTAYGIATTGLLPFSRFSAEMFFRFKSPIFCPIPFQFPSVTWQPIVSRGYSQDMPGDG